MSKTLLFFFSTPFLVSSTLRCIKTKKKKKLPNLCLFSPHRLQNVKKMSLHFRSLNKNSCFLENRIFLSCMKGDYSLKKGVSDSLILIKKKKNKRDPFLKKNGFQVQPFLPQGVPFTLSFRDQKRSGLNQTRCGLEHNENRFFSFTKSTLKNYKHSNLRKYTKKFSLNKKLNSHKFIKKFIKSIRYRILAKFQHNCYKKPKKRSYKTSSKKSLKKKFFKKISRRKNYKKSSEKVFFNKFNEIKAELLDQFRKLRRSRRISAYKEKLEEKKKIRLLYGNLSKKRIQKIYQEALKYRGKINENLLVLLESRLDVILYRICFFKTLHKARQWIQHKKIKINGQIVTLSHYKLQPGDVITAQTKKILEAEIINYLKTKVERFSKRYQNKTFLKNQLMTLYRTPQYYSFFMRLIILKKKLKKNLTRDREIRRKNRKKQKIRFFFFNAKKTRKKQKTRKKLRKTQVKKFLLKLSSYLKRIRSFFSKKHTNNKNKISLRFLKKTASEKLKFAFIKKKKVKIEKKKIKSCLQVQPKVAQGVPFRIPFRGQTRNGLGQTRSVLEYKD